MEISRNTVQIKKTQPFVKWVGGKRGLLGQLLKKVPESFNTYHEPFLGGGAVFFELFSKGLLKNKKIYLSDINTELINTYNAVKNQPIELIQKLQNYKKKHTPEFYYQTRALDRESTFSSLTNIDRAARFIYLNKTCFNGLYRVNKKGYFNTPVGSYKNPNISDKETILNASKALQSAIILNKPFTNTLNYTSKNDLIYLDPPYYPLNKTSNFTSYNQNAFLEKEQKELFALFKGLHEKKCFVLQSNSNTDFIKQLYSDYKIDFIQANRFINSKASGRGKINEVLIKNMN